MDFPQKLQTLRSQKNLTQEQLAEALFVSRTAVSKWESGRGYPGIDSLKAISKFFGVSIDDLLSGDELVSLAQSDSKNKTDSMRNLVFGILDILAVLLLLIPVFSNEIDGYIYSVPLFSRGDSEIWINLADGFLFSLSAVFGILLLALQSCTAGKWVRCKYIFSMSVSIVATMFVILQNEPYAALFILLLLLAKGLFLVKKP